VELQMEKCYLDVELDNDSTGHHLKAGFKDNSNNRINTTNY